MQSHERSELDTAVENKKKGNGSAFPSTDEWRCGGKQPRRNHN